MRKIVLFILFICLIFTTACSDLSECDPNGKIICYSTGSGRFSIEPEAHLRVAVESEEFGAALVDFWNNNHPEAKNIIEPVLMIENNAYTYFSQDDIDLIYLPVDEMAKLYSDLLPIDENLLESINEDLEDRKFLINHESTVFVPMDYRGFVFAYQKDLFTDVTDSDEDGLIDKIDSFEKIFQLMDEYQKEDIFCFYPLQFLEKYTLYPMFSAGGFSFFKENQSKQIGFDSEEFYTSLEFIEELGNHDFYPGVSLSSIEYPYAFSDALDQNNSICTLISTSDIVEEDTYHYSHMPSYKDNILKPLCDVYGYSIYKNSKYPSAASECLRLLRSKEGLELFAEKTNAIVSMKHPEELENYSLEKIEKSKAFAYSEIEPYVALSNAPTKRAWDLYYEIDFLPIIRSLFDHQISCEKAQSLFVEMGDNWLKENGESVGE